MLDGYFNYHSRIADGWWDRRSFLGAWLRMMAADRRWTPPYGPLLTTVLRGGCVPHVDRQQPACIWLEALPGKPNYSGTLSHRQLTSVLMEQPVATALLLADPRRRDGAASLALFGCANDVECLERLTTLALEQAWHRGRTRLIAPAALSPYLGQGALTSHFSDAPPLDTPYQPPYLPEVLAAVMDPGPTSHLYVVIPRRVDLDGPATLRPLTPDDSATVLPSLLAALDTSADAPPPDAAEARFLLQWWQVVPLQGILAEADGHPVGAVLLQPDLAPALRFAQGGRSLLWRLWWIWRRSQGAAAGRLRALVVLPAWRRRGIGGQLWRAALALAHAQGWRALTVGPVQDESRGADFLRARGAVARQRYQGFVVNG